MSMKYTLLDIVQKTLKALREINVDSISDSEMAGDIADLAEDIYYELVMPEFTPEHMTLLQAEALGDTDRPNYLRIPDYVDYVEKVEYQVQDAGDDIEWRKLTYLTPDAFLDLLKGNSSSDSDSQLITDFGDGQFTIKNEEMPTYWTTFDDEYIVCDSVDTTEEASLQASKTRMFGQKLPTFTQSDTFTPDLDAHLFPRYLQEVIARAHYDIKQAPHEKAELSARRQKVKTQNDRRRTRQRSLPYPSYGRRR